MAITFPASPVNGQTHTENGQIFVFDSTRGYWLLKKQDQIVASTSRSTFVATAGQTVHTVNYDPSASVIVSVNGVMLNPQDITSTNGTSIIFDTALALSDEVDIVFHQPTASNLIRQDISDPMATESYVQTYVTNNSSVGVTTVADMAALIALTGMVNGDQALVTANNNLFIYSGSGWYKIATVQNDSPSAITGVDGTYELAVDGTATVITAVSTDPEGFPLTWSYSASGIGSIATVSQSDNVFTITPSTTEANAGTFSLTINATDGVNGAVSTTTNLTLNFIVIVTNSNYTTLLATATGTSDNNNITDTSTNNHSITVNGDAHAGTFSPYRSGGYSTYFDGTGDYIDTGLNNAATDFTFECWVNTTVGGMLMARYASGSALDGFIIDSTSGFPVIQINTNANNLNGTVNLKDGKWHHLAFVRDSNVCKIFVDGILDVSQTDSEAMQVNANWIIGRHGNIASYYYGGYIRDLRWAAGTVRYTSNFTPPTEPLIALSGDNLFTCHLPYIVDGSSTPYTMTSYGNVSTKPFSPYDNLEYASADHGGSIYFDGSGDYLTMPASNDFNFGTNSFTIESWVYSTVAAVGPMFNTHRVGTGSGYYLALLANGGINWGNYVDGTGDITTAAGAFTQNTWNHISLNRDASSSNSLKIYVNGILKYTGTSATDYNTFDYGPFVGGYDPGGTQYYFTGYTSDIVVVNGSVLRTGGTSVGDVAFTPPTTPISTPSNTKLHIKGTDASVIDKSQSSNLKLIGNTTGSTTQVKFADTKSMYFDGAGDYITTTQQELGTGDFTIEGWHYLLSRSNNRNGIFGNYNSYSAGSLGMFAGHSSATTTAYQVAYNGAAFPASVIQGGTIVYNQWVHFAVVRNSGTMSLYIDGTSVDSISATASLNGVGTNFIIGAPSDNLADGMQGYLQDFRITKGLARYTANFTPPTAPLEG